MIYEGMYVIDDDGFSGMVTKIDNTEPDCSIRIFFREKKQTVIIRDKNRVERWNLNWQTGNRGDLTKYNQFKKTNKYLNCSILTIVYI